jgi:hypothetical protein
MSRYAVVVDDDIDPSNLQEKVSSSDVIACRSQPRIVPPILTARPQLR